MFDLFRHQPAYQSRTVTFENPTGEKGQAGRENRGAKGHACDIVPAGKSQTLLDLSGAGIITRIWLTFDNLSARRIRGLRIDMYWDNSPTPAVSAPLGDFFGIGHGRVVRFESELFSNPEGRSFNCAIPMPFRTGAKIVLTNHSSEPMLLFYEINFLRVDTHRADVLYFHTAWNRNPATTLGEDFELLPRVAGKGRYVGTNVAVIADARYGKDWWGEGEVKVFLDGDREHPTLCSTGTEDYIGTAWGQGAFANRYQGCTIADEKMRQWAFYRLHIPDPVLFDSDCRITLQQIGGASKPRVLELMAAGVPITPISVSKGKHGGFHYLFDMPNPPPLQSPEMPDQWVNFYRSDDVAATVYFYLDKPENGLPALAPLEIRLAGIVNAEG